MEDTGNLTNEELSTRLRSLERHVVTQHNSFNEIIALMANQLKELKQTTEDVESRVDSAESKIDSVEDKVDDLERTP